MIERCQQPGHVPVLREAVVRLLDPQPGKVYVDGTVGLGGHTEALFEAAPDITVVGIDLDAEALAIAGKRLALYGSRVHLAHGNFRDIADHLPRSASQGIAGLLLDLGLSSLQVDSASRGFSFRLDGPLDMRMDPSQGLTAADWVNTASEEALTDVLRRFGEERFAARIARSVVASRAENPLKTTRAFAEIIRRAIPRRFHRRQIDPATRSFQAVRIAVNRELDNLRAGLKVGFEIVEPGGVIVVISFHSLEDRIVKEFFRTKALSCVCPPDFPVCVCDKRVEANILTRKPIRASLAEIADNPRARSAKLRAARKVM